MFSRLYIFMVLMEGFVVSFKWNLFLKLLWKLRMELVFLEGLPALSNVFETVKFFKLKQSIQENIGES